MKTKYKYFILIIITVIASIIIYEYIESNEAVTYNTDIVYSQNEIEDLLDQDTDYSINNPKVIINPYKISPLTALIVFKTNDLASVTVTVKGKDDDNDIINTFVPSKTHYISVYGLYPDYENTVIIECSSEKKELKIKTDALPNDIKNGEKTSEFNDFIFTTSKSNGYPVAYDKNGNVRWYLTKPYCYDFTRLSNGYILLGSDKKASSSSSSSLLEMDMLGKIYYEYLLPDGYHHDVYEMDDGNFLVLSGNNKKNLIIEVDRDSGKIIKKFNLKKMLYNQSDSININSIVYDNNTNSILITENKKNMIINIDYSSGEINWTIGGKKRSLKSTENIEFPNNPSGITLTEDGFAFINNKNHLIEYQVNTSDRTVKEIRNVDLGKKVNCSNTEYDGNNFLITCDNKVLKVDDNITTLIHTNDTLYSAKETDMYSGDIYLVNKGVRLGSLGVTPTTENYSVIFHKYSKDIFDKYDLSLTQDNNRLTVIGTFNKTDEVEIILDNVLTKHTYSVDLSSGTLSGNKVYTETYINKEGIYGKHYIYLRINGVIYKLNKYITS